MPSLATSRVLIVVKASPQPSSWYGDTVCVAGVDVESIHPKWLRLYPVPFRYLDGARQFRKYDIILVRTRDAGSDQRPESRKIDAQSIRSVGFLRDWKARAPWIEPLAGPTMCQLIAGAKSNVNAPSLAAIRPVAIDGVTFTKHEGWSQEQIARFDRYRMQGDLFRDAPPILLEPPLLHVHLQFHCQEKGCSGHALGTIDWELTAFQHRFRGRSGAELEAAIRHKFYEVPFGADRQPMIFVGNQEDIRRRASYTILGIYYPRIGDVERTAVLF